MNRKFVFDQDVVTHGKAPGSRAGGPPLVPFYDSGAVLESDGPRELAISMLASFLGIGEELIRDPEAALPHNHRPADGGEGKGWSRMTNDEGTMAGSTERFQKSARDGAAFDGAKVIKVDFQNADECVVAVAGRRQKDRSADPRFFGELSVLSDKEAMNEEIALREIQELTRESFGIAPADFYGRCEKRRAVWARTASMALCHRHTKRTIAEIGVAHGRNHAVVSRAVKRFGAMKEAGGEFAAAVARVEVALVSAGMNKAA